MSFDDWDFEDMGAADEAEATIAAESQQPPVVTDLAVPPAPPPQPLPPYGPPPAGQPVPIPGFYPVAPGYPLAPGAPTDQGYPPQNGMQPAAPAPGGGAIEFAKANPVKTAVGVASVAILAGLAGYYLRGKGEADKEPET